MTSYRETGSGHFCLNLHVAMQIGLYLQPPPWMGSGAWRAVSEDPARDFFEAGRLLLAGGVHAVSKTNDSLEPGRLEVLLPAHRPNDVGEAEEVVPLDDERVVFEERDDDPLQGRHGVDGEDRHRARRALPPDAAAAEERPKVFEHRSMPYVLGHLEHGMDLPPATQAHQRIAVDRD